MKIVLTKILEKLGTANLYTELDTCTNQKAIEFEIEKLGTLREKVIYAMKRLKHNKAPGPNQISIEILKVAGDVSIEAMHQLCNKIW